MKSNALAGRTITGRRWHRVVRDVWNGTGYAYNTPCGQFVWATDDRKPARDVPADDRCRSCVKVGGWS